MENGEGAQESASEVTSSDDKYRLTDDDEFFQAHKIEGDVDALLSPVSSKYDSGGESDFDRYCSANSAMGTPSLCSSMGTFHECTGSDFGSFRSSNFGDNDWGFEGFSLSGKSPRMLEDNRHLLSRGKGDGAGSTAGNGDGEEVDGLDNRWGFNGDAESSSMGDNVGKRVSNPRTKQEMQNLDDVNNNLGKDNHAKKSQDDLGMLLSSVESILTKGADARNMEDELFHDTNSDSSHFMHRNTQPVHSDFERLLSRHIIQSAEREDKGCEEKDETSSRDEHSEGEDSMFNYGSADENEPAVSYLRSVPHHDVKETERGNLMLMSSSVAFGSNDWEDFELDREGNAPASDMLVESWVREEQNTDIGTTYLDFTSIESIGCAQIDLQNERVDESDSLEADVQVCSVDDPQELSYSCSKFPNSSSECVVASVVENARDISTTHEEVQSDDGSEEYLEGCSVDNIFGKQEPSSHEAVLEMGSVNGAQEREHQLAKAEEAGTPDELQVLHIEEAKRSEQQLQPVSGAVTPQASFPTKDVVEDLSTEDFHETNEAELLEDPKINPVSSANKDDRGSSHNDLVPIEDKIASTKGKSLKLNAFYDEVVHDMEEILLESGESPMARLNRNDSTLHSQQPSFLRDGGPTASTSGADDGYHVGHQPVVIDSIEVVGTKQKKGDISFSERLVGVKEHTVYVIRVWSGEHMWEVERRYRDFYTLYRRLKSLFAERGWNLPAPWSSVERDSMKIFGNASPDVIQERSALIQECLCSVLQSGYCPSLPTALVWFLSPPKALSCSHESNAVVEQSFGSSDREVIPILGTKIPLILEIRPPKSIKQMLEAQYYTCSGCHRHFDDGKTRMQELVQTFGWGKPRLCEYTGQLFCSSCHRNDTAVLPARVLHHWDFTEYSISQLAKSYLDSIVDQPMLCVSAVNPFLFSKVPTLLHVVGVRRKIGAMIAYVRCPFRRTIYRGLGSRRYLLESTDFFALRDLIDLSKGAFAALPAILDTVLKKIQEHITEQCLVCCDVGVPCDARQACNDPSSLIFPFQGEQEFERCESCKSVFHKHCFKKLTVCRCGAQLRMKEVNQSSSNMHLAAGGGDLGVNTKSELKSPVGFLSSLFSAARPENTRGEREGDNVILMGSFPPSQ